MALSIASQVIFNADHLTVVRVQTLKCPYRVAVTDKSATIYGPGVEEEYPLETLGPSTLAAEAIALIAVILFEEE